jgi:DNA-binding IclR family transcriptional regulator
MRNLHDKDAAPSAQSVITTSRESRGSRGVESVLVAGHLLHALVRQGGAARLKDLSQESGMPAAKAHRYLVSLIDTGLLRQDRTTLRYALGPLAAQLAELAPHGGDAVEVVAPAVAEFSRQEGRACGVALWTAQGPTIVRWFGVDSEVSITLRPGTLVNMTTSCTGCVVGAYLPRSLSEPRVRAALEASGNGSEAALRKVYAMYARIRKEAIAASHGTRISGINAFSVPVLGAGGNLVAAIVMLGHESVFPARTDSPEAARLKLLAERMSMRFGAATQEGRRGRPGPGECAGPQERATAERRVQPGRARAARHGL